MRSGLWGDGPPNPPKKSPRPPPKSPPPRPACLDPLSTVLHPRRVSDRPHPPTTGPATPAPAHPYGPHHGPVDMSHLQSRYAPPPPPHPLALFESAKPLSHPSPTPTQKGLILQQPSLGCPSDERAGRDEGEADETPSPAAGQPLPCPFAHTDLRDKHVMGGQEAWNTLVADVRTTVGGWSLFCVCGGSVWLLSIHLNPHLPPPPPPKKHTHRWPTSRVAAPRV